VLERENTSDFQRLSPSTSLLPPSINTVSPVHSMSYFRSDNLASWGPAVSHFRGFRFDQLRATRRSHIPLTSSQPCFPARILQSIRWSILVSACGANMSIIPPMSQRFPLFMFLRNIFSCVGDLHLLLFSSPFAESNHQAFVPGWSASSTLQRPKQF
jgi:hypothetical protein